MTDTGRPLPEAAPVAVECNGSRREAVPRSPTAVDFIRSELGLTGTKFVCGTGSCGACVVLVDGVPVASCLLPVEDLAGASLTTVEGLGTGDLHPMQRAFMAHDALQCGFCTPGFVMEAAAFHDAWRKTHGTGRPSRDTVARALAGHLCRCGAYQGIFAAVQGACEGRFDRGPGGGPRVDAFDKVTGTARYTVDITLEGMLHGRIVRSPLGHAEVVDVDATSAIAMPGVAAFVRLGPKDGRVRYVGQELAAVAAVDEQTAREAADAVVWHFMERPVVVGIDQALADDAPNLHGRGWTPPNSSEFIPLPNLRRGNLRGPTSVGSFRRYAARNAVRQAAGSSLLVDQEWEFPAQSHTPLEPHACVADWTDEGLTVYLSTQSVSGSRNLIARRFGLEPERVVVHAEHVGGAFGAKQGLTREAVAAIELSRAAGRPVRVVLDRHEELEVGGYRPPARVHIVLAGREDGSLPAFTATAHADGGASAGQIITLFHRVVYRGSPRALADYDVLTNAPPGRAFRAPGGPLAYASIEGAVDEYARRLGRDPIDLRRSWDPGGLRGGVYDWAAERPMWSGRGEPGSGRFRVGVGVGFGTWTYFFDSDTTVEVRSDARGFTVSTGTQDMGNGTRTTLARSVAAAFGVDPDLVRVDIGTSGALWGPTSSGSRTTPSVVPAAAAAAGELADRLAEAARADLGLAGATRVDGGLQHAGEFVPWADLLPRLEPVVASAGRPADGRRPILPFAIQGTQVGHGLTHSAHVVEVEVDTRLGRIRTRRVDAGVAAGVVHVPELARSQAEGGIIQGIGYALCEERILDPDSGLNITTNLDQYRIPGIAEMPETTVEFIEEGFEHVSGGGVGLSELCTVGVPAAMANAVSAAVGHRFTRLPIRPRDVIEAVR